MLGRVHQHHLSAAGRQIDGERAHDPLLRQLRTQNEQLGRYARLGVNAKVLVIVDKQIVFAFANEPFSLQKSIPHLQTPSLLDLIVKSVDVHLLKVDHYPTLFDSDLVFPFFPLIPITLLYKPVINKN